MKHISAKMSDSYEFNRQYSDSLSDFDSSHVVTAVNDQKHNLIKATLNFAIKSRRKILGLEDIQVYPRVELTSYPTSRDYESDERRLDRKERNRIAARKCRKNRKLRYINLVEVRIDFPPKPTSVTNQQVLYGKCKGCAN